MSASSTTGVRKKMAAAMPLPLFRLLRHGRDRVTMLRTPSVTHQQALLNERGSNPRTFTEKVQARMAFDRRPLLGVFCDKYQMRQYVTERVGAEFLPTLYQASTSAHDLDPAAWPREFALKPSHGSGVALIVSEDAPRRQGRPRPLGWSMYRIHPDDFDWQVIRHDAERWLHLPYWNRPGHPMEWAYQLGTPRLIVEELIHPRHGEHLNDQRFFVFDGAVACVLQYTSLFDELRRDLFTPSWEHLPVVVNNARRTNPTPPRPANLPTMIDLAEALGRSVDFIRVDCYDAIEGVKVGELTPYPRAGENNFDPPDFNQWLGDQWRLPDEVAERANQQHP